MQKTIDDKESETKEEFLSYFYHSKIPPPEKWPGDSSIYLAPSPRAKGITYQLVPQDSGSSPYFPLDGTIVRFEGPTFEGKIISRVKHTDLMTARSKQRECKQDYFKGRSRMFQWVVQGKFKQRIRYDKVVTGQEFQRPFRNAPSAAIVRQGINILRSRLPETFECDLFADKPRFEHPLICGCQSFRVDESQMAETYADNSIIGENDTGGIIENTTILGDQVPNSSEQRRKFFSKLENLQNFYFETEYLYTFEFYSNFFSPTKHRIELAPFFSFDLIPYFNGIPLFFAMAKLKDSEDYLFATELWHKRILEYDVKPAWFANHIPFAKRKKNHRKCKGRELENVIGEG